MHRTCEFNTHTHTDIQTNVYSSNDKGLNFSIIISAVLLWSSALFQNPLSTPQSGWVVILGGSKDGLINGSSQETLSLRVWVSKCILTNELHINRCSSDTALNFIEITCICESANSCLCACACKVFMHFA